MGIFVVGGGLAASQQIGTLQTDVFAVDQNGQLNVVSVTTGVAWQGPQTIGPAGVTTPGAFLAASEQFGAVDQTDVFLVDKNGQLNVFWANAALPWNGPETIGPAGIAPPGAFLAASQQFGAIQQTDVFVVDNNGQLNVFWVNSAGPWQGPQKIGPAGIAPPGAFLAATQQFSSNPQTDVFVVDNNGQLNVFSVQSSGPWQGPQKMGPAGMAPPGSSVAASQQFGTALPQTDVFLVDNNGQLNVFWFNRTGPWEGPGTIGAAGLANPGTFLAVSQQFGAPEQTDVFLIDKNGQLNVVWVNGAGAWQGPETIDRPPTSTVASPGGRAFLAACRQFAAGQQTDVFVVDQFAQLDVFYVQSAGAWYEFPVPGTVHIKPSLTLAWQGNSLLVSGSNFPPETSLALTAVNTTQSGLTAGVNVATDSGGSFLGAALGIFCNPGQGIAVSAATQTNPNMVLASAGVTCFKTT